VALIRREHTHDDHANRRTTKRSVEDLLAQLDDADASIRRKAVRDLRSEWGVANRLLECLRKETSPSVRAAIFDALGENPDEEAVQALIALLRSEDASFRNGAVETLHLMPDMIAPHMESLLQDPDSDVRLFALDLLRTLPHKDAPKWLLEVLNRDVHVNVISIAIDRLADLGDAGMKDDLLAVKARFSDEPFIAFAVDSALRRLEAE